MFLNFPLQLDYYTRIVTFLIVSNANEDKTTIVTLNKNNFNIKETMIIDKNLSLDIEMKPHSISPWKLDSL